MLAKMFSGNMDSLQKDDAYFIDRDGKWFGTILEYIRDGAAQLPKEPEDLQRLLQEARFFMLPELEKWIEERLNSVAVMIEFFTGDYRCSDQECNCGGSGKSFADEPHNSYELDHPRVKRPPVVAEPFLTMNASFSKDDGDQLAVAKSSILPVLRSRFGSGTPGTQAWPEEEAFQRRLGEKLRLLASNGEIMQIEFVVNVLEYSVGCLYDHDYDRIYHHQSFLKARISRKPSSIDVAKRQRRA
ncbi:unnamed protein product [Prorocentrum cordatum]|nr:unnamed protein product [Polarella glacialis]